MMRFRFKIQLLALALLGVLCAGEAHAQHTFGVTAGYGMATGRIEPEREMKALWGSYNAGITWRYYGKQRVVGGFGIDLEYIRQGFSFVQNTLEEDKSKYVYYTRHLNTLMLPVVWQPHVYLFKHRVRVYLEAAATFSYVLSSDYENGLAQRDGKPGWKGDYHYRTERDSRWGYGLAGGGGISLLIRRFELNFRARYYFGYSDVVRNRNKYAGNQTDGYENPFDRTPVRSPLDNLSISVGVSYRFNKEGFSSWKPRRKREKNKEEFNFSKQQQINF